MLNAVQTIQHRMIKTNYHIKKLVDVLEHCDWFEVLSSNLQRTKENYKTFIRISHLQAEMGPRPPKHKGGVLYTGLQYSIPHVLGHSTRHRLSCIHSSHFTHNYSSQFIFHTGHLVTG